MVIELSPLSSVIQMELMFLWYEAEKRSNSVFRIKAASFVEIPQELQDCELSRWSTQFCHYLPSHGVIVAQPDMGHPRLFINTSHYRDLLRFLIFIGLIEAYGIDPQILLHAASPEALQ